MLVRLLLAAVLMGCGPKPAPVVAAQSEAVPLLPYPTRELSCTGSDGVELSGTLSVPEGSGPHPAVLLVSTDRPFDGWADYLARNGVASYRVQATAQTFDTHALLHTLKQQADVLPYEVVVLVDGPASGAVESLASSEDVRGVLVVPPGMDEPAMLERVHGWLGTRFGG